MGPKQNNHVFGGEKPMALSHSIPTKPLRDESTKEPEPQSILKRTKRADPEPKDLKRQRSVSPPPKISRAVQDKLAEEDEEIAALEKKLGLKGKKGLPQSFKDDGLDELLEGLGGEEEVDEGDQQKRKRKAEGDEWLERKRKEARIAAQGKAALIEDEEDDSDMDDEESEEGDEADDDDGASDMSLDGPEFPDDVSEDDEDDFEEDTLDVGDDFGRFQCSYRKVYSAIFTKGSIFRFRRVDSTAAADARIGEQAHRSELDIDPSRHREDLPRKS